MNPRRNLQKRKSRRKKNIAWETSDERIFALVEADFWWTIDRMSLHYAMMDRHLKHKLIHGSREDADTFKPWGTSPCADLSNFRSPE